MYAGRSGKSITTITVFWVLMIGLLKSAEPAFPITPEPLTPIIEKASKSKGPSSLKKSKAKASDEKASLERLSETDLLKSRTAKTPLAASGGKGSATKSKVAPLLETPRGSAAPSRPGFASQLPSALKKGAMPKAAGTAMSGKKGVVPRLPGPVLPKLPGKPDKASSRQPGGFVGKVPPLPGGFAEQRTKGGEQPEKKALKLPVRPGGFLPRKLNADAIHKDDAASKRKSDRAALPSASKGLRLPSLLMPAKKAATGAGSKGLRLPPAPMAGAERMNGHASQAENGSSRALSVPGGLANVVPFLNRQEGTRSTASSPTLPDIITTPPLILAGRESLPDTVTTPPLILVGRDGGRNAGEAGSPASSGREWLPDTIATPPLILAGREAPPDTVTTPPLVLAGREPPPDTVTTPPLVLAGRESPPDTITTPPLILVGKQQR